MRAITLFNRVLALQVVRVLDVAPGESAGGGPVVVRVALKARKRLDCPYCGFSTTAGYDTRWSESSWRHLDFSGRPAVISMLRRRLVCPEHGVVVQGVPFASAGSRFSTDFEDTVAWLVTRADKTTVSAFARIAWRTVDAICERVVADQIDATRFEGLVNIGVDEISWRKHHRSLTWSRTMPPQRSSGVRRGRMPPRWTVPTSPVCSHCPRPTAELLTANVSAG